MYQINRDSNNIVQLKERLFGELGFREREHLQEWIAKNPDVLGEELLIIQKEFDGFSETNERLDLLALDKAGNLVVIENKLDDTGRDVVWQALKYASYCSTLSTSQIVSIYQKFLDQTASDGDAAILITDFLEAEDFSSIVLNRDDQRIMFVANHYRKEVTSTVLWLLDHDVNIQCFRATPYSLRDDLFLQIEQIIPVPEASEFVINIKEKAKEDSGKSKKVAETEAELLRFWQSVKARLVEEGTTYFDNVTPRGRWHMGFSRGRGRFAMVIGRTGLRVELYFANDAEKALFDAMGRCKEEVHNQFGGTLIWERLDDKKASRIKYELPTSDLNKVGQWDSPEALEFRISWFTKSIIKFHDDLFPIWERVQNNIGN